MQRSTPIWFAAAVLVASLPAQEAKINKVPIRSTSAADGQQMFQTYCASCHGADAKGNGPAAPALKVPATDLTKLTRNNKGEFPANHVVYTLSQASDTTKAHGSSDMPVWGQVFRGSGESQFATQIRVYNLMRYLESVQDMPSTPAAKPKTTRADRAPYAHEINAGDGKAMFQAYCASCHGMDGRGGGPAAATLKAAATDLTMIAKKNNGTFPEDKVRDILGWQRGTTAHGSKDMPVWGELLRANREGEEIVKMRLRNILVYVKSLQR